MWIRDGEDLRINMAYQLTNIPLQCLAFGQQLFCLLAQLLYSEDTEVLIRKLLLKSKYKNIFLKTVNNLTVIFEWLQEELARKAKRY
jgi:hypothetical protein